MIFVIGHPSVDREPNAGTVLGELEVIEVIDVIKVIEGRIASITFITSITFIFQSLP
jgi:hypothetical protein